MQYHAVTPQPDPSVLSYLRALIASLGPQQNPHAIGSNAGDYGPYGLSSPHAIPQLPPTAYLGGGLDLPSVGMFKNPPVEPQIGDGAQLGPIYNPPAGVLPPLQNTTVQGGGLELPSVGLLKNPPIMPDLMSAFQLNPPYNPPAGVLPPLQPTMMRGGGLDLPSVGLFKNSPVGPSIGDAIQLNPEYNPVTAGVLPPLKPPTQVGSTSTGTPPTMTANPEELQKSLGSGMDTLAQILFDPAMGPTAWAQMMFGSPDATAKATAKPVTGVDKTVPTGQDAPVLGGDVYNQPGGTTPGQTGAGFNIPADLEPPAPIHYMAPPAMPAPVAPDFTAMENYLKQATPRGINPVLLNNLMMNSVMGGLASGASQVDTSKPNTWSQVLAAAGGGGAQGAALGTKARIAEAENMRQLGADYNVRMGNFEGEKAKAIAAHTNAVAETNYNNKVNEYKTGLQNDEAQRGYTKELRDLYRPQVTATTNGLVVQSYNPQTKSVEIKTYDTNNLWNQSSKLDDITKAFGSNSIVTQNIKSGAIIDAIKQQPVEMREPALRHETIKQIIESGNGDSIFGDAYKKASEQATNEFAGLAAQSPEKVAPLIQARIADLLFNDKGLAEVSTEWAERAANAGVPLAKAYMKAH